MLLDELLVDLPVLLLQPLDELERLAPSLAIDQGGKGVARKRSVGEGVEGNAERVRLGEHVLEREAVRNNLLKPERVVRGRRGRHQRLGRKRRLHGSDLNQFRGEKAVRMTEQET